MEINPSERDALVDPAVVGILAVAVAISAFCVVAYDSDYGRTMPLWQNILRATLGCFGGVLIAFGPFGLLLILVARLVRRDRSR